MVTQEEMNELESLMRDITEREKLLLEKEADVRMEREEIMRAKAAFEVLVNFRDRLKPGTKLENDLRLSISERLADYSDATLKRAVESAIMTVGSRQAFFSSVDIVDHFKRIPEGQKPDYDLEKSRANISSYMRDFQEEGLISEISPASGRRPATYSLGPGAVALR